MSIYISNDIYMCQERNEALLTICELGWTDSLSRAMLIGLTCQVTGDHFEALGTTSLAQTINRPWIAGRRCRADFRLPDSHRSGAGPNQREPARRPPRRP